MNEPSYIPDWKDSMSDGCSVPGLLQHIPAIKQACEVCRDLCVQHDKAYYYGGTDEQKLDADYSLYKGMIKRVDPKTAMEFFEAVRVFGKQFWGTRTSWHGKQLLEAP